MSLKFIAASGILGIGTEILLRTGKVEIVRKRNFNIAKETKISRGIGMLILSNHPSLVETLVLPALFWPRFWVRPSMVPISTPDEGNFMEAKLFDSKLKGWVKSFMMSVPTIPIDRKNPLKAGKGMIRIKNSLDEGKTPLLFAEGGRTGRETNPDNLRHYEGRTIRKFQPGVAAMLKKTENPFILLPVWIEGAEMVLPINSRMPNFGRGKKIRIHFGTPRLMDAKTKDSMTKEELLDFLEIQVLKAKCPQ